jgi:hypothetical protein
LCYLESILLLTRLKLIYRDNIRNSRNKKPKEGSEFQQFKRVSAINIKLSNESAPKKDLKSKKFNFLRFTPGTYFLLFRRMSTVKQKSIKISKIKFPKIGINIESAHQAKEPLLESRYRDPALHNIYTTEVNNDNKNRLLIEFGDFILF